MNILLFTRSRTRLGALLLSLGLLMGASAVCAQAPLADGQVIKIDQAVGKITIKHGPLKQFGMDDGMTPLQTGDKINFAPDRMNGQFVVTKIEKAR